MSLFTPNFTGPPLAEYVRLPFTERIHRQATDWARNGFGAPSGSIAFYIAKIAAWAVLGLWIACSTSGLGPFWQVDSWWAEPIVYEKLLLWAILWEILSLGAASGPATFHFLPPFAGIFHWLRPGTMRRPPWHGRIPGTAGYRRTLLDVALYLLVIATLVYGLVISGVPSPWLPLSDAGILPTAAMAAPILPLLLLGLRDQVPFLAARAEQYLPALLFAAVLNPVDFMIAAKALICVVWFGAAVSKLGPHFTFVLPPMMSNAPWMVSQRINQSFYRNFPHDLRPSRLAFLIGHVLGTAVEMLCPIILFFSGNYVASLIAAVLIFGMHVVITSTMPLAVPLEWNIHFMFLIPFLFFGFPAWGGYGPWDISSPLVAVFITLVLLTLPVLGNLRPDIVSFLPSMRQYAGNWATTMWAFKPEALERLYKEFPAAAPQETMLAKFFGEEASMKLLEKCIAWRCMHSQGRGLVSALMKELGPECEGYLLREGENIGGWALGWNFGDGHLHGVPFMLDMQKVMNFAPGEVIAVFAESQPIHRRTQRYTIVDLGVGIVEEGTWSTEDTTRTQPWLPDGPVPLTPDAQYRDRMTLSASKSPTGGDAAHYGGHHTAATPAAPSSPVSP